MPIRQGGILASRASTWPRDHFCRSTMAPRALWPTTWNEFLPISMSDRGIGHLRHGVVLVFGAPCQLRLRAGQEHGRTIPLAAIPYARNLSHLVALSCCVPMDAGYRPNSKASALDCS